MLSNYCSTFVLNENNEDLSRDNIAPITFAQISFRVYLLTLISLVIVYKMLSFIESPHNLTEEGRASFKQKERKEKPKNKKTKKKNEVLFDNL